MAAKRRVPSEEGPFGTEHFRWPVCVSGYRWKMRPYQFRGKWCEGRILVPNDQNSIRENNPLKEPVLFRRLAECPLTESAILEFACKHGPLGLPLWLGMQATLGRKTESSWSTNGSSGLGPAENQLAWHFHIAQIRSVLAIYDALMSGRLSDLGNWVLPERGDKQIADGRSNVLSHRWYVDLQIPPGEWQEVTCLKDLPPEDGLGIDRHAAAWRLLIELTNRNLRDFCSPYLQPRPRRSDSFSLKMQPRNLIGDCWWQIARLHTGEASYRPCKVCSRQIELSRDGEGFRVDREFCSPACKAKDYRAKIRRAKELHRGEVGPTDREGVGDNGRDGGGMAHQEEITDAEGEAMARSKRGRGEGGVYQRESDRLWVGTVSLGYDGNGKRKRKTVYGQSKKEVLDKLREIQAAARVGNVPDPGNMIVSQLLDRWLESLRAKVTAATFEQKEIHTRVHLKPRIGGVRLSKLNGIHFEGLITELRNDGVGPWAARHALDAFDYAMNYAVRLKLIASNPCRSIDKPTPKKGEIAFLTPPQARLVREGSAGFPIHPLLVTALATACRQGELLALAWSDVELQEGTLTVRRALSITKAGFVVKEPKTPSARRTIALPQFAVDTLVSLKAERLKAGQLSAPVFCTRTGNYLNKKNVLRAFRAVVTRVNKGLETEPGAKRIPKTIRFHDLRHTVASILLSSGHSLRAVSQRLGHSNPAMTLRVYAHCLPGDDGKLADGLEKMLG